MVNDIIGDTLARLKNSFERGKDTVEVLNSKNSLSLIENIKREGFVSDYSVDEEKNVIIVTLKYDDSGDPVATHFERVSKPGQRIYVSKKEILPVMNGRGISIISTSSGVMTGALAKSKGLGGEYICKIW